MIVGATLRSDFRPSAKKHLFTRIRCGIRSEPLRFRFEGW
jgi:hypothetical protein